MMKAVIYQEFGNPSVLQVSEYSKPQPEANEVLIKVVAAGMNRADLAQRKGNYPAPKNCVQNILGLEVSGIIEEVGENVSSWKKGDQICALLPGGGYAGYVTVDAGSCLPIPKGFSLEEAAGLPEVLLTVWQNIFQIGKLQPKENVLIYGGSGGIGSMAIQLVSGFGANAWTLASTAEKIEYCKSLGAEKVINYHTQDLVEEFGRNSVNLILDSVGGKYLDKNLSVLKTEGRLVYINAREGKGNLNIFKMMQKRIHLTGSTLRSRSLTHKTQLVNDAVEKAFPILESENFKSIPTEKFSINDVVKAHELMESRDFMGKIILCF